VIVEIGLFRIDPARSDEFAPVAEEIRGAFARGGIDGLRSFRMGHAIEDPGRWAVIVGWDSSDDHARFVVSTEGERQRALLERFMVEAPEVLHYRFENAGAR
jgi:heme-degrading monooxygenase HmoA